MTRKRIIERISARVFCHLEQNGGNPVTIFNSSTKLNKLTHQKLAKDCQWESVIIHNNNSNK